MYDNKILVNIYVLSLSKNCEIFIPVNEKVGHITKLLANILDSINTSGNSIIMNADTGVCYKNNDLIRNTDIKNGCKLVFL
ncbi:MAG: hypothetical protein ACI33S_04220 [Bacilli bacterium]|nr:hypothetical protein [bacterium]